MYLTIVTWKQILINDYGIYVSLKELSKSADIIKVYLDKALPADVINIDKRYSPSNQSYIKIFVNEDGFDPEGPDTQLFKQ